jgi:hypothetical protein
MVLGHGLRPAMAQSRTNERGQVGQIRQNCRRIMASSSGMLNLILHIGPHKTGTTSLQQALLKTYGAPKPQKIWYPTPPQLGPGHAVMARDIIVGSDAFVRHTVDTAARGSCEQLILSAETFATCAYRNRIDNLVKQTSGAKIHIVTTLSPIYHRAISLWQQGVRRGRTRTAIAESLDDVLAQPGIAPDLAQRFVESFPEARLSVVITNRAAPQDLYSRFMEATGLRIPPSGDDDAMSNVSLGLIEAECLRGFNVGVTSAGLTREGADLGRTLLRKLIASEKWRAVVPNVPLRLPGQWIEPLAQRTAETISGLRNLAAEGRIEVFGDLDSLDDSKSATERLV